MRRTNLLVRVILILAVVFSLILSFLIWTNNQRYERRTDTEAGTTTDSITSANQQNLSQVYLPTAVVNVDNKKNQTLVYNHKENLALEVRQVVQKWTFHSFRRSAVSYHELMNQSGTVQMIYADQMSLKLFGSVVKQERLKDVVNDIAFTRIIFSTSNNLAHVYFLDDISQKVWQSRISETRIATIRHLVTKADMNLAVSQEQLGERPQVFFKNEVTLRPYSYLINRRNENTYISALMSNDKNTNVESRESGGQTTYYGGSYHNQLTVDHRSDQLTFSNNSQTDVPNNLKSLLENSFTALTDIGNPLTDIRYYSVDQTNNMVAFRSFVEGFPIFQQSDFGSVKVKFSNTGSQTAFSSRILQVPVPAKANQVTLPATETVMNKLVAANYSRKSIQNLVIGYRWVTDTTDADIVDLMPTYYVKINNRWRDYQDWLQDQTGTEAQ